MLYLAELSHIGIIRISGDDAKTFLQGQLTCHLDEITPHQSRLGAHCNLKGRIISLFRIFQMGGSQNEYFLSIPLTMVPISIQNLKKYALFSKVQIEDATSAISRIGIYGPQSAQFLEKMAIIESDCSVCLIQGSQPRYEIYALPAVMQSLLFKHQEHYHPLTSHDWELLDIQAGLPAIYPETSELILPHHANLAILEGISFNKGCYVGQEIIARMQFKGKIKKHMYRAFVESKLAPKPGDSIYVQNGNEGEGTGTVIRTAQTDAGYELLIIIDDEHSGFEKAHLGALTGPSLKPLDLPYSIS